MVCRERHADFCLNNTVKHSNFIIKIFIEIHYWFQFIRPSGSEVVTRLYKGRPFLYISVTASPVFGLIARSLLQISVTT
jgi:hypothetical protein